LSPFRKNWPLVYIISLIGRSVFLPALRLQFPPDGNPLIPFQFFDTVLVSGYYYRFVIYTDTKLEDTQ
jgi:hypothetical protein